MDNEEFLQHPGITNSDVYQLLRKFHQDEFLENSKLRQLYLVQKCRKENPLFSNSQSLRFVFSQILLKMEQGSERQQHYAYILKGRFWNRYSIVKMTTSGEMDQISPRTFSSEQNKAVSAFCNVLTEEEQLLVKQHSYSGNPVTALSVNRGQEAKDLERIQETTSSMKSAENAFRGRSTKILGFVILIFLFILILVIRPGKLDENLSLKNSAAIPESVVSTEKSDTNNSDDAMSDNAYYGSESFPVTVTNDQFLRSQGVVVFDSDLTPGILNNKVRSIAVSSKGIWIGYFATDQNPISGVSYYNKENKTIMTCNQAVFTSGQNINDIVIDRNNNVWVGMEKGGIASFDGKTWRLYTTKDGLPSDWIYGLFVDEDNSIWAATYKGVAYYKDGVWTTKFSVENGSLVNDRTHSIAIDKFRNIWIGYIEDGLSVYRSESKSWEHFSQASGLSGNYVRGIVFSSDENGTNSSWIATYDGGVSRFENGTWTTFTKDNGLPGNEVRDIKCDKFGRVWVATSNGVSYYANGQWNPYNNLDTYDLSFGTNCDGRTDYCINDDNLWTGTNSMGITHSHTPLTNKGVDILKVCFVEQSGNEVCPDLIFDPALNTVIANHPDPLNPGDSFYMKVTVSPYRPNQLLESRGDMLVNIDADETMRFGAWTHIPVLGSIESGQEFTFIDTNNPFVVPELVGLNSATYQSTWRTWMHTRMIGPVIRITFTIVNNAP